MAEMLVLAAISCVNKPQVAVGRCHNEPARKSTSQSSTEVQSLRTPRVVLGKLIAQLHVRCTT